MTKSQSINQQLDHLFRKESGKMVAVLVNIFGTENLELAEDVVQSTLLKALETWKFKGVPENPKAWLYKAAKNNAIDIIRREKRNETFDFSDPERQLLTSEYTIIPSIDSFWKEDRVKDEFLAMMFACCHPDISPENQITFILKTMCGFSTKEVAKAFLTSEDVISKRIYRTKEYFRKNKIRPEIPSENEVEMRLGAVSEAIYMMFNEGYSSTHSQELIRQDLISQALFLGKELTDNEKTDLPQINALMALMCFHSARLESRLSENNEIILLKDQDRSLWNQELIELGKVYLEKAGRGNTISTFHFEAMIALEHCWAPKYSDTNWSAILGYYEQLLNYSFDPVIYLNMCFAKLEFYGPEVALNALEQIKENKQIQNYYLYHSVLGEINLQLGDIKKTMEHFKKAESLTKSSQEKKLLQDKIQRIKQ